MPSRPQTIRFPPRNDAWVQAAATRARTNFSDYINGLVDHDIARYTGRWRHKPTIIDAFPVADIIRQTNPPRWVADAFDLGILTVDGDGLRVISREDPYRAEPEWWLCRDIKGGIYAIQPDVFKESYEPADLP